MKKCFNYFGLVFFLLFTQSSFSYDCPGKINNVVLSPDGTLTVSYGNIAWVYLCSVSTTRNGVAPDTCKSIQSLLMAAKLADKNITFWFNDTSGDCTNAVHPAWADLKNWYYGPALL